MSAVDFAAQFENSEYALERAEEATEKETKERKQAVEGLSTKQWLQQELEGQSKPVPIMGREFHFTPVGNQRVEEILELASKEAANLDRDDVDDLEDVDSDDLDDMPKFVRSMRETLEEHCLDEYMAEKGMKKIPLDILQMVFEDVAMGQGLNEQQGNV